MKLLWCLPGFLLIVTLSGCPDGGASREAGSNPASGEHLSGEVSIDGSSTVAPISTAIAEEFSLMHPDVRIPVGTSGTGGGFKKFYGGEIDICDASRPIKESEVKACEEAGIEFIELKVAIDGLTVVVNPQNTWVKSLSVEDLKKIWYQDSTVSKWSEVKDGYPGEPIELFGPDTDSGTFDYFTEEILGEKGAIRSDYQQSSDDNFLVSGVANNKNALGYFGYAYYIENQDKLRAVPISSGDGEPVVPNPETIESGTYTPLSRPLYIYVRKDALKKPEVVAFLEFYLSDEAREYISETGYITLTEAQYAEQKKAVDDAVKAVK